METRAPYVLVGSFVLVFIAGLVVAVLWFARVQFREHQVYYDIYFHASVNGLSQGSTVRYNGIPVGRVAEIKLDPLDPTQVRVTIELGTGVVVKSDTVAALEMQGLAGGAYVNLTGGTRGAPMLARAPGERYPVIASRPSGLQRVVTTAPEALARLIALADQLSEILSADNRKAIGETLQNLRQLTRAAASHTAEIDSAIDDGAQTLHGLRNTLESANAILAALKGLTAPQGNMQETLRSIGETSRHFDALAQRLDALVAENQPKIRDFTGRGLDQLEQLVQQAQQLVAQLSRIADSIERDPSRLIYGDRRPGYNPR
jgi:phospholipid/cholesterol/gamma-HCH transport system substrate-binding protein